MPELQKGWYRPMTTADRVPELGDILYRPGGGKMRCLPDVAGRYFCLTYDNGGGGRWESRADLIVHAYEYDSRADGEPADVLEEPQG